LIYCNKPMDALDKADALAIMTEWGDYQRPDFKDMAARMRGPVVFDGRNLYEPERMKHLGFTYHSIGRPAVRK
jgi:UDPglucose 6-dehydrogenase